MGKVRFQISMSLDGYIAGPDQSEENPLGIGGDRLHEWAYKLDEWRKQHGEEGGEANASSAVVREAQANVGAVIMGRSMFGGGPGPWNEDEPWNGWWGEEPPFHTPVYVLTHHAREPLMKGDTTFFFVTEGIEPALQQALASADDRDVLIGGGATVAQQYFRAGAIEEFDLHVAPVLLRAGRRLFESVGDLQIEQVRVVEGPDATHIKYRVTR